MRKFPFSVVVPTYNCAKYIEEALVSVIEQDIGFKDNVELVIVDDGSTDDTASICERYVAFAPDNIRYIYQDNVGVSAARRAGLRVATGDYVNFLDADDMWSLDALSAIEAFIESHEGVGVVCAKHVFFGRQSGDHPLSYKFGNDAVVDLKVTFDWPLLSLNSTFVRRDLLREEYFDNSLRTHEDFVVMSQVLLAELKYGVVKKPRYWYRKREQGDSALDTSTMTREWYEVPLSRCYERLFDLSVERYGEILPFIQYAVAYDIQWRVRNAFAHPLDDEGLALYKQRLREVLSQIDDGIILAQRNMKVRQRLYVLALKYGLRYDEAVSRCLPLGSSELFWRAPHEGADRFVRIMSLVECSKAQLDFVTREGDRLVFEGHLMTFLDPSRLEMRASGSKWTIKAELFPRKDVSAQYFFDGDTFTATGFRLSIPCKKESSVAFTLKIDARVVKVRFKTGKFCPFGFRRHDYAVFDDYVVKVIKGDVSHVAIERVDKKDLLRREATFEARAVSADRDLRDVLGYRARAFIDRVLMERDGESVWLISDRTTMAGDNGEALFRYLHDNPVAGVKPYFVINGDSPDFERMRQYGEVVAFGSSRHKALHMRADIIASSAGEDYVFNPFGSQHWVVKGFERFKYVFLQHGVTQNDLSGWMNRYKKNVSLITAASPLERAAFLDNPAYGLEPASVALTGFPRHDLLVEQAKDTAVEKRVIIAPTWRSYIAGSLDPATGAWTENPEFEESDYYRFYQSLIGDRRLAEAAKEKGYSIDFLIHPAFVREAHKFHGDHVNVLADYDYREVFARSAILMTDYSSVAFDFALLGKPILYAQFDLEEVQRRHTWREGYFKYDEHGFGDVVHSVDEAVGALIALMDNPVMSRRYRDRVDAFFEGAPQSGRSEKVVQAILALSGRS